MYCLAAIVLSKLQGSKFNYFTAIFLLVQQNRRQKSERCQPTPPTAPRPQVQSLPTQPSAIQCCVEASHGGKHHAPITSRVLHAVVQKKLAIFSHRTMVQTNTTFYNGVPPSRLAVRLKALGPKIFHQQKPLQERCPYIRVGAQTRNITAAHGPAWP